MAEESKGIALAILGIVAVIAIIGLVLMFSKMKATGEVYGGGLYWGEGGWQSEGLSTRYLYTPETQQPGAVERITGGGKLGPEEKTAGPYLKNVGQDFYASEIGISDCRMAVAAGYLPAGYTAQIEKGDGKVNWYGDCYGVHKPWPAAFLPEAIPGYCCKEITYR